MCSVANPQDYASLKVITDLGVDVAGIAITLFMVVLLFSELTRNVQHLIKDPEPPFPENT